ncbi:uncharacterized protein FTOL_06524 [Fusarium torulosum]|uniref:Uncharacterized protein n=1 Tax=Fusarium torulosum TaxID=33205 RepID=A0AAE8M9L2_9HYPO|nr:uncharacterized protein FTOL_06524 [Fusarium torulosum]
MLPGSVGELLIFRASEQRQTLQPSDSEEGQGQWSLLKLWAIPLLLVDSGSRDTLKIVQQPTVHQSSDKL